MTTLGARLRQLRRERGCTLQQVSDGSKLTPSFLSRLERGIVNISVGNLRKVATFFDVPITHFFTEELLPHGIVVKASQIVFDSDDGEKIRCASLLPAEVDSLAAELIVIAPGNKGTEPLFAGSRVLFYVLEGELCCDIAGREQRLGQGDVLYQRRSAVIRWSNQGDEDVVILATSLRSEER